MMNLVNARPIGARAWTPSHAPRAMRGVPQLVSLALMIIALGFAILHPYCELAFANGGNGPFAGFSAAEASPAAAQPCHEEESTTICCASVQDWTLVKQAGTLVSWTPGGTLGAVFFVIAGLPLIASSRGAARYRFAAPPERSFYARSARILR